jgi:cation/acetate symporter
MTETVAAPVARTTAVALGGLSAGARAIPTALLASLPGLVYLAGFDHLAYGLGLLAGIVMAGLLIAPQVARPGAATVPDALGRRFGSIAAGAAGVVIVLVVLPLLTAELILVGIVSEAAFGMPYLAALPAALAASGAIALFTDERTFGRMAIAAFALFAASLLVPLALMAMKEGTLLPHLVYGHTLSAIGAMEEKLVENGLVDFDTFSMHTTPFLRLSGLDLIALVVSVALGTAVLPQLVGALAAGRPPAAVRVTGAWTAFFAMLVLIAVPALAAYAKHEIYGAMTRGTPLAELPGWLKASLQAGVARIHGTSPYLLSAVADAVRAGHADAAAVSNFLVDATASAQWNALDDATRNLVLEAARVVAGGTGTVWEVYGTSLLPAAAAAAGNDAALLSQAALVLEPVGLMLAIPGLAGLSGWGATLLMLGVLALPLVMAAALLRAALPFRRKGSSSWRTLVPTIAMAAFAAGLATLRPMDIVTIVVSAMSLAAAGLFPALAVGLVWKRATAAGVIAAMLVGGGVTLYYNVGIQVFPAAFYRTWAPLSNAGEFASEEFATLETEVRDAEGDDARAVAQDALDTLARGTATRRGLANWFGIDSAAGAIFGVPLGLVVLVLISLATPARARPSDATPA